MTGFFVPNLGNRNPIPHNTDLVTFEHKMPKSCDLRLHSRTRNVVIIENYGVVVCFVGASFRIFPS